MIRMLRSGLRFLIHRPAVAVPAILVLAAGLGASTAVFTLLDTVVLRPLPYPGSERIVGFWGQGTWSRAELDFLREHLDEWEAVGAFATGEVTWRGDGGGPGPSLVRVAAVSHDIFTILATAPASGRLLQAADEQPETRVVVVSDGFWKRRLNADPEVVGQVFSVDDTSVEVVGVMPAGFQFPNPEIELWFPLEMDRDSGAYRGANFLDVLAKYSPGSSLSAARAEVATLVTKLRQEMGQDPTSTRQAPPTIEPWTSQLTRSARPPLMILMVASGLLLLVACVNVANLLLAQAVRREREMAVRSALGADRRSLFTQLAGESLVLAVAATGLGLLLAWWSIDLLRALLPSDVPRLELMAVDGRIFLFAAALGTLTSVLFGTLPALYSSRTDLRGSLLEGTAGSGLGLRRRRWRWLLVAGEMALAGLLTVAAVSSVRSFLLLATEDPGFDRRGVVTLRPEVSGDDYRQHQAVVSFYEQAVERLSAVSGVETAGAISRLPIAEGGAFQELWIEGHQPAPGEKPVVYWRVVAGDYFETLRIPLVDGTVFDGSVKADDPFIGLVNETLARTYWPGESAVGKRLRNSADEEEWVTVVGVVGDVRHEDLRQGAQFTVYRPLAQAPAWLSSMALVARTEIEPVAALPALRNALRTMAPDVPVHRMIALDDVVTRSIAQERLAGAAIGVYGVLALALAAVGVFGLLSYAVGERRREISLRIALGASPRSILGEVVREGMGPALAGTAVGVFGAWIVGRSLESFLYEVSARDPWTHGGVALALLAVAYAACWLPAHRATQVQPATVLRQD